MRFTISFLVQIALWAGEPCLVVDGDRFLAADLAKAAPLFAGADPAAPAGYTPAPGMQRLLRRAELETISRQMGLSGEVPSSLCITRLAEPLTREQVSQAVEAALEGLGARIELLDFSRFPVPRGKLEFPLSGLISPRSGLRIEPAVWKGRLVYSGARSMGVWAKVRVGVARPRVVAAVDLPAGRPLEASNLKLETVEEYPQGENYLRELEKAVGLTPRRLVRAGEPLRASLLSTPNEVERGDKVDVTVESGGARLSFAARAETSAGIGGRVLVKNPENGKRFAARVESKGKVVVLTEGGASDK